MNLGTAQVIRANSRSLPLADDSVDLVVTSPPYFALRSYQDGGEHYAGQIGDEPTPAEFVDSLLEVTRECMRVLKPSGSLWVNLGDKYSSNSGAANNNMAEWASSNATRGGHANAQAKPAAARPRIKGFPQKTLLGIPWRYALRCVDDLDLILRRDLIWAKPNGLPESVTDRCRTTHEYWFHFTLLPRYFSAVDEIREPSTTDPSGKVPGSVWTISPVEPVRLPEHLATPHFATFPTAWPKRIISAWCPDGGTVLDPFGGTGTTAMVAKALGRHGISVDMSADYCRLAEWRTNDRNQLAKVLGIEKTNAPDPDQLDLFGGNAA